MDSLQDFINDLSENVRRTAVILSDDIHDDNVFLALIEINARYGATPPFEIVVELKDPNKQKNLEQFNITKIIVSNRIVSFYALQNLVKSDSTEFYDTILDYGRGEFDIWIDKACFIFDMVGDAPISFDSYSQFVLSAFLGTDKSILPIGLARNESNTFFCFDLDKSQEFVLQPTDGLIYVKYRVDV
jgi:hypothetical protein